MEEFHVFPWDFQPPECVCVSRTQRERSAALTGSGMPCGVPVLHVRVPRLSPMFVGCPRRGRTRVDVHAAPQSLGHGNLLGSEPVNRSCFYCQRVKEAGGLKENKRYVISTQSWGQWTHHFYHYSNFLYTMELISIINQLLHNFDFFFVLFMLSSSWFFNNICPKF